MSASTLAALPVKDEQRALGSQYLIVAGVLVAFLGVLFYVLGQPTSDLPLDRSQRALLLPVFALVALTDADHRRVLWARFAAQGL